MDPIVNIEVKPPKKPEPRAEYVRPSARVKGIQPASTPDVLDPNSGESVRKYDTIARNPIVKTCLDSRIAGVFWSGWSLQSQNNYDHYQMFEALDQEIIRYLHQTTCNLENDSFDNILKSTLLSSYIYGFYVHEYTWDYENTWDVIKLRPLPSYQFDLWTNPLEDVTELFHRPTGMFIKEDHLYKFNTQPYPFNIDANPYGRSELQSVYHDVKLLEVLEEARCKGSQLLAIRPVIHYFNGERSDELVQEIQNSVFKLESASILSLQMSVNPSEPDKMIKEDELTVLDDRASSDGIAEIKDIIDQLTKRITRALGLPDDLGFSSMPVGSYAKSQTEMTLFSSRLVRDQEYLENIVNRYIIPKLLHYRFQFLPRDYKLPKFQFNTIEEDAQEKLISSYATLIQMGILDPTEPWIRETLELPAKGSSLKSQFTKDKGFFKKLSRLLFNRKR